MALPLAGVVRDPTRQAATQPKHSAVLRPASALFHQAVKNYMGVISQLGRASEAPNTAVSEAPTCYVELTSLKLIRFSAFWAKCLRVA
jgi:hypothetical protein